MLTHENTLRLGLVDLPTLAAPLSAADFTVFGGGPFREAAAEIKAAAEQGPVAAIFVGDSPQPGIKAWLTRMTSHGAVVVILRGDLPRLEVEGARSVDLPATVGELLAAAGLTATDESTAAVGIDVDGAVAAPTADRAAAAPVAPVAEAPAVEAPVMDSAAVASPTVETAAAVAPAQVSATPAPEPVRPPAVQASPILFAAQRREAQPAPDEESIPETPAAPVATGSSPWDDDPAVPAPAPAAAPVPVPAPAAVTASPWDDQPVAVEPEPYLPPPVTHDEDWFGQSAPVAPAHTVVPAPEASAPAAQAPVAQNLWTHPEGVPTSPSADSQAGPQWADPDLGPFASPTPAPQPVDRQPTAYQDDPWGQHQQAPVAVLAPPAGQPVQHELTKHDVPEPIFTAPAYQPAPEPVYAPIDQPTAASAYDPAPAYVDPQAAVDAMFAAAANPREAAPVPQAPRRIRGHGSPLAIVCAEKGGVGKTNTTLALAERAASLAPGKRVVLVDMNRGQGDVRKYLKLGGAQVPSILDAAISGNIAEAVLSPEQVTAARHNSLPPISFGVVLAPEPEAADPRIVTPDVYQRVIDMVRDQADLVIVDTQIVEIHDTSGLVDGLIVPALAHDAFGVTLTDTSAPGVSNLVTMLGYFAQQGVPTNRLMIVINRALAGYDTNVLRGMLSKYGMFSGAVEEKSLLARQANMGRIPHNDPSLAPVLDAVLLRVTGWPCFQPTAPVAAKKKFFGGLGRKAKN